MTLPRRRPRGVAVAFAFLLVALVSRVRATSPATHVGHPGATLESDLRRVHTEYVAAQSLTDAALSPSSSPLTRRDALVQLGRMFLYGNQTVVAPTAVNATLALSFFATAADLGHPDAQFHLGVAYSYGLWGVPRDDAMAMTYYYFASLAQHMGAVMALGYRHLLGVGAPKNCESAVRYYEVAANKAMALREANPTKPAIYDLPHRRLKTVHETQHKKNIPSDAAIVDYYQFSSDKGDPEATINLATLYYYGARGLQQDLAQAARLFHKAYDLGASGSAYHLGHMYNYGIGVQQSNETALKYLQEAVKEGSTAAHNELAFMHMHGKGTEQNHEQALTLFKAAAKQGNMEAFYNLGVLHMQGSGMSSTARRRKDPEYEVAHGYFQVAAHQGHTLSSHKLGHMSLHGIGTTRSCKNAVDSFKLVAERGEWDRMLSRAFKDFKNQDYEAAFIKYAVMAQQGYEVAQHNAAYLLDFGFLTPLFASPIMASTPSLPSTMVSHSSSSLTRAEAEAGAIQLYKMAAMQGNVDANLKIGDYYYYGKGGHAVDYTKASAHYSLASKRSNAQAMFNLALMYEHGIGVQQDFFLAKRYFDKASDAHNDAHVPVTLALWKLRTHIMLKAWKRWWDELVGNVPPTSSATEPTSASASRSWSSQLAERLHAWLESTDDASSGSAPTASRPTTSSARAWEWHELVRSDDVLILAVALALALVVYIRSERQNRLDRELVDAPERRPAPHEG
ncbi:hypothetical protein ATCC90586_009528 [Pythium insidiosum]|nr:hypothetical protein ATCC90586_009528 [Pythium insidiosum]